MTFFEAALEVLRTVQRPLDYKTITQFAVSRGLLGHVGHTPDIVMASCLIRAVQRGESGALVRLDNGEFALKCWGDCSEGFQESPYNPPPVAGAAVPSVNVGLCDDETSTKLLRDEGVHFRQSVQVKFDHAAFVIDDDEIPLDESPVPAGEGKFGQVKSELYAQQNSHFNLCAAIVKVLRNSTGPATANSIAQILSQKYGVQIHEQSVVLAMRTDNALRASRGKRSIFSHVVPDSWTLSENLLTQQILRLESKLYDMSRQMRTCSQQALAIKIRGLSCQAWQQLATVILRHLNYTIIAQCPDTEDPSSLILRAEESRGLAFVPVIIKVVHSPLVKTDDVTRFRELIREFGYDHGIILANGDVSKDALNECTTRDYPIYAYASRQLAPIMMDAKIGIVPNELPVVFIDHGFFQALSDPVDHSVLDEFSETEGSPEENKMISSDTDEEDYGLDDVMDSGEYVVDNE